MYAGGFHNFRTDGGQDIAQQCNPNGGPFGLPIIDFQWNDPYAYTKQSIGQLLLDQTGQLPSPSSSVTLQFQTTSDNILVRVEAGSVQTNGPAVVIEVLDPIGQVLAELLAQGPTQLALPSAGSYSVVVTPASIPVNKFYVKINQINVTPAPEVTSNFNLLFFDSGGAFITTISGDALATKAPILVAELIYYAHFQLVIARSNVPTATNPADRIRYVGQNFEALNYASYLNTSTFGHACAAGGNGIAAYSAFRPFAPEPYTSPGPPRVYSIATTKG